MASVEAVTKTPQEVEPRWSAATSESELELPSSLESWVAALGLWASVDEPTYQLVARCFGNGRGPEWPFLCSLLLHAGLAEPGSATSSVASPVVPSICWPRASTCATTPPSSRRNPTR